MNLRTLLAALAGGIVMFFLGFLFFGVLLAKFFEGYMVKYAGLMKDPPEFIPLFLFNLLYAWLIAFVADHWAGIKTFPAGAKAGAIIMLAIGLAMDLEYFAFMNMYTSFFVPTIVHALVVIVMGAISGGVIGLVLGFFGKKAEAA